MLVLSRKEQEAILIGDNILVTVVRIGPGKVRIGVQAPDDVKIMRSELNPLNSENESCTLSPLATSKTSNDSASTA